MLFKYSACDLAPFNVRCVLSQFCKLEFCITYLLHYACPGSLTFAHRRSKYHVFIFGFGQKLITMTLLRL